MTFADSPLLSRLTSRRLPFRAGLVLAAGMVIGGFAPVGAPAAFAQKPLDKTKPLGDPANDPYTRGGKEEYMKAAGYVSMGGFEFGPPPDTTVETNGFLSYLDIRWIETAHFQIGVALPQVKVTQSERDKIRAELTEMEPIFGDEIDPRTRVLDPWIRAHLYARRCEKHYADIQAMLGVTDEDFAKNKPLWNGTTKYMGTGPYLGQIGKYEVLLLPSEGAAKTYLRDRLGLTTKLSQRWNIIPRDTQTVIIHTDQGKLRVDESLHGHLVFNLTHNMINGYKHYSYDMPVWITEGAAHWFERQYNPKFNTFDAAEGAAAEMSSKADWKPEAKKIVSSGKAPTFASLINLRTFAELELDHHFMTWSIFDYMMTVHPEFVKKYFDRLSGLKNAEGYDDYSRFEDEQRLVFKEVLDMNYREFDLAWQAWVLETY
ncbi:hypothetical protein Poly30_11600 [Planctomycetes bacterium Poly30]|uniref:DUF1570 domain-containing protein n=1 Tax=Saltatorellus ferox TaxID=2528018 RepID=A0A518ENJ7_9BACT|nr:hypothetical protein Poly30_11600 [Planctomycetes bacterium Poly30]